MTNLFSTASAVSPGAEFDVSYPTSFLVDSTLHMSDTVTLEIQKADLTYKVLKQVPDGLTVITGPGHYRVSKLATAGVVSVDYGS